ncbi:CaiB/BaiF CoA transferase family protein [Natronorubrum sp. FCH18a]|uniref:CaiB/BaiF CoA transferase family protein n=1 Tax=Natronorubrum sp. FCH18a TaxID=3447018 RepID=UPI003F50D4A4
MKQRLLDDVTIIDLGQIYNGPYCSLLLSYLGADVTKIEPPSGEPLRGRVDDGEAPEFVMLNSNKKGVTLNLKSEEGKEIFKDLVEDADVLVENYSVGTMDGLGLGYEVLSELNPELIYAHGSGFGEEGPYNRYPAMDLTIQAISGIMDVTGFPDGPPVKTGIAVGDFMGGIHLVAGILGALYERERTGEGQFVEASMHDSVFPTLMSPLGAYFSDDDVPSRTGNRHSGLAHSPYNVYETADGHVAIFGVSTDHWHSLLEVVGREDLKDDPRFETNVKRANRLDEVDEIVESWTAERSRKEVERTLLEAGVPFGPVKELEEVVNDPHLKERQMINEIEHPSFGEISVPGSPIRLSNSELPDIEPSPEKGRDNEEVYCSQLGYSRDELERLEEENVI